MVPLPSFGNRILRGQNDLRSEVQGGARTIRGQPADVQALQAIFDRPGERPAPHTARRRFLARTRIEPPKKPDMIDRRKLLQARSAAGSLASRTVHASASSPPAPGPDADTLKWRAIEAMTSGMPAVDLELMHQAMLKVIQGRTNLILYWSELLDWKGQTLTPNTEVIYPKPFFDTRDAGPIVVEVPPAAPRSPPRGRRQRAAHDAPGRARSALRLDDPVRRATTSTSRGSSKTNLGCSATAR